jgi:hypothetical protein
MPTSAPLTEALGPGDSCSAARSRSNWLQLVGGLNGQHDRFGMVENSVEVDLDRVVSRRSAATFTISVIRSRVNPSTGPACSPPRFRVPRKEYMPVQGSASGGWLAAVQPAITQVRRKWAHGFSSLRSSGSASTANCRVAAPGVPPTLNGRHAA